jgi:hypothetical protein
MNKTRNMSISEVFTVLGGTTAVARALNVGPSTASEMKRRGRIPAEYWRDLLLAARATGHPEITADLLTEMHARGTKGIPTGFAEGESAPFDVEERPSADGATVPEKGHFSRFRHLRKNRFQTLEQINDHIDALREEWTRR